MVEILAQRAPRHVIADVTLLLDLLFAHLRRERPHRGAFTQEFERHALTDVTLRAAVHQEAFGRLTEYIDEAGRHREPRCVYFLTRARVAKVTDRGDAIAKNRDVGLTRGTARSVEHLTATNDEVVTTARRERRTSGADQRQRRAPNNCRRNMNRSTFGPRAA